MVQNLKIGDVVFSLTKGQGVVKNQCQALEVEFEGKTELYNENSEEMKELSYTPWFNEAGEITATFKNKEDYQKDIIFDEGDIVYYQIRGIWNIGRFLRRTSENSMVINISRNLAEVETLEINQDNTPLYYFPMTEAKMLILAEAPKRWGYFNLGQIVFNGEEWGIVHKILENRLLEVKFLNGEIKTYTLEGCLPEDRYTRILSYTEDITLASAYPHDMINYNAVPIGTPIVVQEENPKTRNMDLYLTTVYKGTLPKLYGNYGAKIETKVYTCGKNTLNPDGTNLFYNVEDHVTLYNNNRVKRKRRDRR